MRHGLASSTRAIFLLKPIFSSYQPSLFISRSLSTTPSLSARRKKKKALGTSTITDKALPKAPETLHISNANQPEPSPSTKLNDTDAFAQETSQLSHPLPQEIPGSVKESPEPLSSSKLAPSLDSAPEHTEKRGSPTVKAAAKSSTSFRATGHKTKEGRRQAVRAQERKWTILNPAFKPEHNRRRGPTSEDKMHSYIQFITTPTSDTPGTALLLHFDDKRYIIGNAHEGLQRASLQTGARVLKSKDIFLTGRTEWQSNGGLLGMILSLADAAIASAASKAEIYRLRLEKWRKREEEGGRGKKKKKGLDGKPDTNPSQATPAPANTQHVEEDPTVRLHGGPNLTHMLATARSFIFRKGTPIKVFEHVGEEEVVDSAQRNWEPTWSDDRIQVWAMPIIPSGVSEVTESPKSESPRKRSLGEFMTGEPPSQAEISDQWNVRPIPPEDQAERDKQTREFAVSEMFSSAWSYNNLIETPLRQVKMPAALFVRDSETKELKKYEGPTPDGTAPMPDINVLVRQAWPGARIDHLPPTKRSSTAMSFIIRNQKMRGKFKPAAARARNVPPGPLWAALASGSSVQSSDGVTVTPDMVLEPGKEGSGVAVVDLPSSEYVHDLVHRSEWRAERVMSGVGAVIWILGPGVVQDPTLLKFIEGQPGVQHIISSPERCPDYLSMTSAASMAIRHNQIDPARYAVPVHSNAVPSTADKASIAVDTSLSNFCHLARRGLRLQLEPKFVISEETVVPILNTAHVVRETSQDSLKLSQAAREEINSPAVQAETLNQNLPSPDAEIICLGTGSALPSLHRNVSATLLRVPGCGSYLMDCGENTLGQLKRMYTAPQLAELLQDLKVIWISHLHADHHLGLTSVMKAWYEEVHGKDEVKRRRPTITEQMLDPAKLLEDGKRLFIVGNEHMRRWLEEYSSVEDFGYDQLVPLVSIPINRRAVDICSLEWNGINVGFNNSKDPTVKSAIRKATGLSNLVSCHVSHCYGAQAVSFTFPTGFKFSYSGDTRPSEVFAQIGKHSTVLLHEATFDDELKSDAIAKKHSTTSEAIGVGVAMGARRVILTHFSQRYQNVPSMSALDPRSVKLEDAEDVDDPSAGMDQPVEESTSPVKAQATIDNLLDGLYEKPSQTHAEPQPQMQTLQQTSAPILPSASLSNTLAQIIASNINPTPRPQLNDMKIGVAFDYMRVKVSDIMHLEKFTPALRELYKETVDEAKDDTAAKEAFSDDENDVLKKEQAGKVEKRTREEKAERAKRGQIKAARKKQENKEKWEKETRRKDEKSKSGEGPMEEVEIADEWSVFRRVGEVGEEQRWEMRGD